MTSLEFIEKEIKQLEERKENAFKNEYYSVYKECYQKITALQQIKSELEAWEEMKKYIILEKGMLASYDVTYEYIELKNGCIDESNSPEEGKSLTVIKKALEVGE